MMAKINLSGSDRRAFSLKRRAAFYADMAAFMDAQVPPFQALTKMEAIARKRRQTRRLANVYRHVLRRMPGGDSLAVALAPWVPGNEAVMLVGADTAGSVVFRHALGEMAVLLDRQLKAKQKIRKMLIFNGMTLTVIVGVIAFIMKLVVPQLRTSATPDMLTKMSFAPSYFAFGQWVIDDGAFLAVAIAVIALAVGWSLNHWVRSWPWWSRRWFDEHLMPWTLHARTQATFFLATTSAMMRAGIPLKTVVTGMLPFSSPWMHHHLRRLLRDLELGLPEVDALGSGLLPTDTGDRLKIYALMNDFTGIMTRLSADNFATFEASVEQLDAFLRLITLLLLALFIVSTLFMVFDYANAMQSSLSSFH